MVSQDTLCIAPSILASDFSRLAEEVTAVAEAGADWIHVDVMDGQFVPNLTIGAPVVRALKARTSLPLDCHLMVNTPERLIPAFVEAGAAVITIHAEATAHPHRALQTIRDAGVKAGIALNPHTPPSAVEYLLELSDLVLVMSVNPGFGGQKFIPEVLPKLEALRRLIDQSGREIHLEVDGGIKPGTAKQVVEAGADTLVAGSAVFGSSDYSAAIAALRRDAA